MQEGKVLKELVDELVKKAEADAGTAKRKAKVKGYKIA
jgi:hypothetical protein